MTIKAPFQPMYGSNQVVAAAAGTAVAPNKLHRSPKQVRVTNSGANKGYFRTFSSAEAAVTAAVGQATVADACVTPGLSTTVTKPFEHDSIAYISAAGTTFEIIQGEGF